MSINETVPHHRNRNRDEKGLSRRDFLLRAVSAPAVTVAGSTLGGSTPIAAENTTPDHPQSISAAGQLLRQGSLTSEQLTNDYLDASERLQPQLNAFISVLRASALDTARQRDREMAAGRDRGPLHGIPIVVKDLYAMAGTTTTVGSKAYRNRKTDEDATVVRHLKEAGAVILGKTNMNEFAAGVSGTNSEFGDIHNPWDLARSPGGSSSGTGAALAAGLCLGGTGTDTGGSIRVPASWCGIAGIRPTFGLVSLAGVFPRSYSLDSAGPLAREVRDLAYLLDSMAGFDPDDPHSSFAQPTESYTRNLDGGVKNLTFGTIENYTYRDVDPSVAEAVREAADGFARLGAKIVEIEVPPLEGQLDYNKLFSDVLLYEFNQILGDEYRRAPDAASLYGPIVKNNIDTGSRVSRDDYERILKSRPAIIAQVKSAFKRVDAMLTPALPTVAPLLKASAQDYGRGRQFTIPFSFTALPSVVVPCGFSPEKLPIGLQIVGNHFQEGLLLRIATAFEGATGFHKRRPPVFFP